MRKITHEADLDKARQGDDAAFTRLVQPLQPELRAHCYRMLGSTHDADDALQDALLRAWRALPTFEGRSTLRSWLYTVATRTCLDTAERRGRRALPIDLGPASDHPVHDDTPRTDIAWLGPYPDTDPDGHYERREAIELAFIAALQHLPGNQRAALLLFDVLGYTVAEIAAMMDTTTTSVNSALARARRNLPAPPPPSTGDAGAVVAAFAQALQDGDADTLVELLTRDVTWTMPPLPHWYAGIDAVTAFATQIPMRSCGDWRYLPTSANGRPAIAFYLWDENSQAHLAWAVTLFTVHEDRIASITSFIGEEYFVSMNLGTIFENPTSFTK